VTKTIDRQFQIPRIINIYYYGHTFLAMNTALPVLTSFRGNPLLVDPLLWGLFQLIVVVNNPNRKWRNQIKNTENIKGWFLNNKKYNIKSKFIKLNYIFLIDRLSNKENVVKVQQRWSSNRTKREGNDNCKKWENNWTVKRSAEE